MQLGSVAWPRRSVTVSAPEVAPSTDTDHTPSPPPSPQSPPQSPPPPEDAIITPTTPSTDTLPITVSAAVPEGAAEPIVADAPEGTEDEDEAPPSIIAFREKMKLLRAAHALTKVTDTDTPISADTSTEIVEVAEVVNFAKSGRIGRSW